MSLAFQTHSTPAAGDGTTPPRSHAPWSRVSHNTPHGLLLGDRHVCPTRSDRSHSGHRCEQGIAPTDAHSLDATASVDATAVDAAPTDVPPVPRHVTIVVTGNLLLEPRVTAAALAHRDRGRLGWILARAALLISPHEIFFADFFATPLSTQFHSPGSGHLGALGAPAQFARDLSHAGFDVLSIATNHAYDQTAQGLDDTVRAIRGAGMGAVGAGRTDDEAYAPWIWEHEGIRVAFLGFTLRTNDGPGTNPNDVRVARVENPSRAIAAVRAARNAADLVVVGVHWSRENERTVAGAQRALADRLVAAGADVVAGTGPFVLQPVERVSSTRGDAVVAYSLGNFVSDQASRYHAGMHVAAPSSDPRMRDGALLRITFELPESAPIRVLSMGAQGLWTDHDGDDIRVLPLRGVDEEIRSDRLRAITEALGAAVRVRP